MLIDIFLFILIIFLLSVSPLPALPLIIACYAKLGFIGGFICTMTAANLAVFSHYYIGANFRKKNFKWPRFQKLIDNYSEKLSLLSTFDLFILRLSNIFKTKILNLLLGFSNYPIRKLLIINNITNFLWQFLNYFFASKVDILSNILIRINISLSISRLISIISISCIVILSSRIIIFFLKKILRNKFPRT